MKAKLVYKTVNGLAPQRLCEIFKNVNEIHNYNLRGSLTKLYIPKPKTELLKRVSVVVWLRYGTKLPLRYATIHIPVKNVCNKLSFSTSTLTSP